jgi:large subunit ribosomal protein L28
MAKCDLTGKRRLLGHRVSHSNIKTKHWQMPNVQSKRVWDEESQRWVRLKLSTRAIRTITKKGLRASLRDIGLELVEPA